MSNIAYLRNAYGIPAKKGMRVKLKKAYFNIPSDGGVITGAKHAYLRIRVDGEKHSRFFHPTYGVIYPADGTPPTSGICTGHAAPIVNGYCFDCGLPRK
jgi:hypothetical protein